jgi:hypothetical protein
MADNEKPADDTPARRVTIVDVFARDGLQTV